jgi:autotransporter-associated beta strand protein
MRREAKLAAAVTAAIVLPSTLMLSKASAGLVASDSYLIGGSPTSGQYVANTPLKSVDPTNTETGFVAGAYTGGTQTSNIQIDGTGDNYPWLGASSTTSGRVKWLGYSADAATRSVARNLTTVPNSNVYYESMLVIEGTVTSFAAGQATSTLGGFGNAQIPIAGDTGTTNVSTGLYIGFANDGVSSYNNNTGNLVIRYSSGFDSSGNSIDSDAIVINGSTVATTSITHDNTYCVVTKITVPSNGGLDTVNWWLNPTVGTSDATLNSSSGASGTFTGNIVSGTNPGSSFSRLTYVSQGGYWPAYWDEPRLSTDLAGLGFVGASNLIWNNAGGSGNGFTWDTTNPNFNNGTSPVAFSTVLHDNVTFNDNNNSANNPYAYFVVLQNPTTGAAISVSPGSTNFNNSAGNYVVEGVGSITGNGALTKLGTAAVYMNNSGGNTYTGGTNVAGGTLYLGAANALPSGRSLTIGSGASFVANGLGSGIALKIGSLSIAGQLDLQNTGLDVAAATPSPIGTVTAYLSGGYNGGKWNGTSGAIASSIAAADSTHLTALGSLVNDNGSGVPLYGTSGTIAASFDGITPADGDVLVKYTYYGDANLDGKVDGTDYSRIDAAYAADKTTPGTLTGWYNGDFNYDGVIDGSDYTLIDNAYNSQGTQFTAQIASAIAVATAEIANATPGATVGTATAVPEPATLGLIGFTVFGLLGRRRRQVIAGE